MSPGLISRCLALIPTERVDRGDFPNATVTIKPAGDPTSAHHVNVQRSVVRHLALARTLLLDLQDLNSAVT